MARRKNATELNPDYAVARQFYAHLLSNWQRYDEALREIDEARTIDPLSPMMHTFAGAIITAGRRYDEAVSPLRQALTIDPDFFPTHSVLGLWHQFSGDPEKAIEEFRIAHRLSGGNVLQLSYQGSVLGQVGRRDEAREILAAAFALVTAALGDDQATFEWLDKAHGARDIALVFLPGDRRWDSLRTDPRFEDVLRRCGFPAQAR